MSAPARPSSVALLERLVTALKARGLVSEEELAARQATRNLAPLRSEIIQINYAKAGDIAQLLQSTRSSDRNASSPIATERACSARPPSRASWPSTSPPFCRCGRG